MFYGWVTQTRNYILAKDRQQDKQLCLLVLIAEIFSNFYHVLDKNLLDSTVYLENKRASLANTRLKK